MLCHKQIFLYIKEKIASFKDNLSLIYEETVTEKIDP